MQGQLQGLKGTVEIGEDLNIVVQENILLRRDQDLNGHPFICTTWWMLLLPKHRLPPPRY